MKGRFIVLEGPDGSGTTLHSRLLAEYLRSKGEEVVLTAEPTDGSIGRLIREILHGKEAIPSAALQLLFTADRAWHVEQVIAPALQAGKTVISDRYSMSTVAYGTALGLSKEWMEELNGRFIEPDVQILTLPSLEVCLERLGRRSESDILERREIQEKIHKEYRLLAQEDSSIRIVNTDGDKETVAAQVRAALA
jgi:dTMP kinase